MSAQIKMLLLDTNVWLDYFFGDRPDSAAAAKLISLANQKGINLLYAITSTKDVYYLAANQFKRYARAAADGALSQGEAKAAEQTASALVQSMEELGVAVALDAGDVHIALKQRATHRDYEDNLIVAAALRAKADVLVTNDKELRAHSMVATQSAEDMCRQLEG